MRISEELKRALIVDLEQVLGVKLDEETKQELMRCYEITIGTHEKKFLLTNVDDYEVVVLCEKCGKKYLPHLMKPLTICDECAEELKSNYEKCQNCGVTGVIKDGKYSEDCMKCYGSGKIKVEQD